MKLFIQSAKLISKHSEFHNQVIDLYINNGKIEAIGNNLTPPEKVNIYTHKNLHISAGWLDLGANFSDPGNEHKETIESGINAAAKGGFTAVAISPATEPPIDNKSIVQYVKNKANGAIVDLLPMGAISKGIHGIELAELFDMYETGAVAFTDGKASVQNPNLLKTALLYCKAFDGLVINYADHKDLSHKGMMHEGEKSMHLGLKGIPALAEEIIVNRDLYLLEYTEGKIHFSTLSTAKSVELIKEAKKKGLRVTADVSAAHLLIDDSYLDEFDTRFKVQPPFRDKSHIKALIKGLKDKTIDVITSNHVPEDIEAKKREFDHAAFGIINLQTAFGAANTALKGKLELEEIIEKLADNPRRVLGLEPIQIKEGEMANLTLFSPEENWKLEKSDIVSKSKNSPFIGMELIGKPLGIINHNQIVYS